MLELKERSGSGIESTALDWLVAAFSLAGDNVLCS